MSHTILHIDSSPMGARSVSKKLTQQVVSKLTEKYPDTHVVYHDLSTEILPHLNGEILGSFFTPKENHTPAQAEAIRVSDQLTDELLAADVIVIGAPMWNFNIPSSLKAWIDHISRMGRTFKYTETGPQGLVASDKKVIVVSSRGGIYTEGPAQAFDHQESYLKAIFGFLGISDVSFVRAEGVSMGEESVAKALKAAESHLAEVLLTA